MKMPKGAVDLSVVIPAFNAEFHVRDAIADALNQTLKNIEVLVVNDGSTDGTQQVLETIAAREPRLRVFQFTENAGVSAARNLGITQARGEYIFFMDADDRLIGPESLTTAVEWANTHRLDSLWIPLSHGDPARSKEMDSSRIQPYGWDRLLTGRLTPLLTKPGSSVVENLAVDQRLLARAILDESVNSPVKLYRTGFLRQHQILFDEALPIAEDLVFNLAVVSNASEVRILDRAIYRCVRATGSVTRSHRPNLYTELEVARRRARAVCSIKIDDNVWKILRYKNAVSVARRGRARENPGTAPSVVEAGKGNERVYPTIRYGIYWALLTTVFFCCNPDRVALFVSGISRVRGFTGSLGRNILITPDSPRQHHS